MNAQLSLKATAPGLLGLAGGAYRIFCYRLSALRSYETESHFVSGFYAAPGG
jgi:hypothetical protein